MASRGVIRAVKGLVVHVEFDDDYPALNELLLAGDEKKSPLLVDNVTGSGMVICLNVRAVNTLEKNMEVERTGKGIEIPVGPELIGRVVDAMGAPIDGHPPVTGKNLKYRNIFENPARSTAMKVSKPEILETGIKVLDFFAPFVKGRKVGVIGGAGVGKTVLTMEMINNVSRTGAGMAFFAGIGERIREGHELYQTLGEADLLKNTCMFFGQMDQNPVQRSLIALSAVTLAEYFRDEHHKDILFFADNMYRYIQAKNEVSTILDQIPAEGGYEPTIFSDVKVLQDRLASNENGSITAVQTIYVPADDLSDPAVQMIQHELDSIIVLSRKVAEQGIRPAVDLLKTTSSLLTPEIVGERHYLLSIQVQALLQKYESLKGIIAIIGENELSPEDRADFAKAKKLIEYFTQKMFVMTKMNGIPGEFVKREEMLTKIEEMII
ncbi:MAG: atpD [Candidatus Saccharibacteria bacterium]|nr:atpD [Candidatus Saccharibacteria bacterium]